MRLTTLRLAMSSCHTSVARLVRPEFAHVHQHVELAGGAVERHLLHPPGYQLTVLGAADPAGTPAAS
jgi:hypothetical protein